MLDHEYAGRKGLGAQMSYTVRNGDVGKELLAASRDDGCVTMWYSSMSSASMAAAYSAETEASGCNSKGLNII